MLQIAHEGLVPILDEMLHNLQTFGFRMGTLLAKSGQQIIFQVGTQLHRFERQLAYFIVVVACCGLGLV